MRFVIQATFNNPFMYASPILIFVSPTFCVFATNYARKLDRKGSSGHLQRFCCLKSKSFVISLNFEIQ